MAKEFLDSSARINYTRENTGSQGFKKAIRWSYLTAAGLLGLSQILVGCSQKEAMSVIAAPEPAKATATLTPDNQPTATATISLTPGIGGAESIPTFPAGHRRAGENPRIIEANRRADEAAAKATAQAGGKIPPEGTQIPKETSTPTEVKTSCKIFPDKFCSGRLIEKEIINPITKEKVTMYYVEFTPPAGITISSPIDGQAGNAPRETTNDFIVSVKNLQDPRRLSYSVAGGIEPSKSGDVSTGEAIGKSDGRPITFWVSSINGKELTYHLDKIQEVVPSIIGQTPQIFSGATYSNSQTINIDRFQ